MHVETFYDSDTATFTHVVVDETTQKCAVIDSVLDYDQDAARTSTQSADCIIQYIQKNNLKNEWILETHIHADHITAASYLKTHIGGKTGIGSGVKKILSSWVPKFETEQDTPLDGRQFDVLFEEGDSFKIGSLDVLVWHTPGHTSACACYLIKNAIFVGDTMFPPHIGTARCDFPGGSTIDMYHSIQRIYTLPDDTRVFLCHNYPEPGIKLISVLSVRDEKSQNKLIKPDTSIEEYTQKRETRDKTLAVPKLLYPAVQTNMRLGEFGIKSANGLQYIKMPVNDI